MRDHRKLKAFIVADELVLSIHQCVLKFPSRETFVLGAQLRKASLSTASNLVEGCARQGQAEFLHFLNIAMGSTMEVEYQLSVARRLGYSVNSTLEASASEVCKVLRGLIQYHLST